MQRSISYLCMSPVPLVKGTDAIFTEIESLRNHFGGEITSIYPYKQPKSEVPLWQYGVRQFLSIKLKERRNSLNHIFSTGLHDLPFISYLSKKVIYSIYAGLPEDSYLPKKKVLDKIALFTVSNNRDKELLNSLGVNNVKVILPSYDFDKITKHKLRPIPTDKIKLLYASAPWEERQFETKGIYLLLEAMKQNKNLSITFLWRGILSQKMDELIEKYNVANQANVINEFVDINTYLEDHDAIILLANDTRVVKSFPHSLIEGILAGRPLITTNDIAISDLIREHELGSIINEFNTLSVLESINKIKNNYSKLTENIGLFNASIFSTKNNYDSYADTYSSI